MKILKFNSDKISSEKIIHYYNSALSALDVKFRQPNDDLRYLTDAERGALFDSARVELSIEAGFMLLAYVESLFRTDFVLRVENRKWKDPLTLYFRDTYNVATKPYKYGLEDIFYGWRYKSGRCDEQMDNIIANLPQYFKYRNWIAHGRYWIFDEENYIRRYNFDSICLLVGQIHKHFKDKLKHSNRMGERE